MNENSSIREPFERLVVRLQAACEEVYGDRLIALAIFGSVGRGTPRPDSDVDFLLVVDPLPDGRMARSREFESVEDHLGDALEAAREDGVSTRLSPVFKTPHEIRLHTPLLLDLVEDAEIRIDREGFLASELKALEDRLEELGARRIWSGSAWHWDLKPDYQAGDVFEL